MRILDSFPDPKFDPKVDESPALAVLAGGCFWCTEGVFRQIPGVLNVTPGYAGGDPKRATYEEVCKKDTGHAEVILITYDPAQISYGQLLKNFFWLAHDPTQTDGQGADIGPQYRSAIFYGDDHQHSVAEQYIRQLDEAHVFAAPIATRLEQLTEFFEAEKYHHDYAAQHPGQPYIRGVAQPKIDHARGVYGKPQSS